MMAPYVLARIVRIVFAVLFAVFLLGSLPAPTFAIEQITDFSSDITIAKDSSLTITETIQYVFEVPRHGIIRDISRIHPDTPSQPGKERYLAITVTEVRNNDQVVPFSITENRHTVSVKIGDPDQTIMGEQTYQITYTVVGAISYIQSGGADLYWNVTGDSWAVPIRNVTTRVYAPAGLLRGERSCYYGATGLTASCQSRIDDDGTVVFSARNLNPREGLTIAQAVERSQLEYVVLERWKPLWLWLPLIGFWFLGLGIAVFRYVTAHDRDHPIIAHFEPYPNVKPMYAGLLMDGRLDARDLTACLVYLAERGYLQIRKTEQKVLFFFEVDDYEIELVKPLDDSIGQFEREVLTLVLGEPLEVGGKMQLAKLRTLTQASNAEKQKILAKLRGDLEKDLEKNEFFQSSLATMWRDQGLRKRLIVGGVILLLLAAVIPDNFLLREIFIIGTLVIVAFAHRRRTVKGYEALDHLKGFQLFLETTDKDRFAFHNAPTKNPQQFMEYLPYAIAFGVEKEWAEVFKDIAIPTPNWYEGSNVAGFSALNLSSSLGAFSTAFAAAATAPPSSGGGFSGGGAGGGGGGSW